MDYQTNTLSIDECYIFCRQCKCNIPETNVVKIKNYLESSLTYQAFFIEFMTKNTPCIISNVTKNWSGSEWTLHNKPNFELLNNKFGDKVVPVANCDEKYYNAQKKEDQTLKQYLDYWQAFIFSNYSKDRPCLYLKDWHFTRDFPKENMYRVPQFFASDWLNEYFTSRTDIQDDYRFVYMGPKGSWTPLHADVYSSYSWSVNLCGRKRWILYPPGQEQYLVDKSGNLAYDVESPSMQDQSLYKQYNKLEQSFEIIQNAGEAIFVPSGWHHQVWNLEDTISVNHNWVNGCNVDRLWAAIKSSLAAVKREISDCADMEDWHQHCQLMLNASFGLDYTQLCELLMYVVCARTKCVRENTPLEVYGGWLLGVNHLKFDLVQAKSILEQLITDEDFTNLDYFLKNKMYMEDTIKEVNELVVQDKSGLLEL